MRDGGKSRYDHDLSWVAGDDDAARSAPAGTIGAQPVHDERRLAMKIRRRDGTMGEVDDDYILQDGEALRSR